MNPIRLRAALLVAAVWLCLAPNQAAFADQRTVSFHLGAQCMCAQCAFDAQHALKKLDGVQRVTLSTKLRRLDIVLDETKRSVSSLAVFISKLDLGSESALLWPTSDADTTQAANNLARVPGVRSAKADPKTHTALVTFASTPAVVTAQLDRAVAQADAAGTQAKEALPSHV